MNKGILPVFCLAIFIAGCTTGYTPTFESNELSVDSIVDQYQTPTIENSKTPNATETREALLFSDPNNQVELLHLGFESMLSGEDYDPSIFVLHKYYEGIEFRILGEDLYIIQAIEAESMEDSWGLAVESIFIASSMVDFFEWDINHIELIYPNLANSEYRFFIDGSEIISNSANDINFLVDEMSFELSPQTIAMMTQSAVEQSTPTSPPRTITIPYPTNTVTYPTRTSVPPTSAPPKTSECKTFSSGTVNCMIKKAYCSYQPSVKGQPTFCNDAPYPNHSFSYIVWGSDVSYLNGHCILIYGKIEYYNGKPEISWQNNNGFDGYCD